MTKSDNSSKINVKGDTMSLEYQRYGRNKETLINNTYINSGEYRNKFDNITNNIGVNRILYSKAKEMLQHRSGTKIEDMYWIDGDTGEIVASALNEQQENSVLYTKTILKAISNKTNLITMHTHPSSMPPSIADFNSNLKHNYGIGLVICHDWSIYMYSFKQNVPYKLYELYLEEFIENGYAEREAQFQTLNRIKRNFDIDFREVTSNED